MDVLLGIGPHKGAHTAVALDGRVHCSTKRTSGGSAVARGPGAPPPPMPRWRSRTTAGTFDGCVR